ncbi:MULTISPECIES: class D beta-lactamase [Flavobacteriales]|uniref:Beta-lactamase n=3 Tax=Flavobacteriales TaxID=200644 RepID=A0AAP3AJC5_RIEAN|nr:MULTISPECIES: class D beta-lactamase [Flavobacteriales]ALU26623.1 class D beta-lactamase [Myroides odoratimimus]MBT0534641.1 class D beta-lactamase [Riemerella anatipestifer]MBT0559044.1 class D beta-lactamase [Riemerella anatipestifer]MBT0563203.1 class D beta-lactamase [Riemerella anatipestifer]MCE3023225.1 class D beta-lactamase [Riemerella anatipestifer]
MRKIIILLNIIILVNFTANCQTKKLNTKEVVKTEFGNILDSLEVNGSILIYDVKNKIYYSNDFSWAKTGVIPASTFKIPNSIIALETGIIKNDSAIFKWNGEKRRFKIWEEDLTFKKAFQVSCVPCYQEIARKVGVKRMKKYLRKLDYKGMVFDTLTIDNFWLEGNSKISQKQQIDFLRKFYFSKFPISDRTIKIVKNIMEIERTENYILSGKTGLSSIEEKYNGWFVGYVETKSNVYFFATNVIPTDGLNVDDFISSRINVTKNALKQMNIMK